MANISLRSEDVSAEAVVAFAAQNHLPVLNMSDDSGTTPYIIAAQRIANGEIFENMAPPCIGLIELNGDQPDAWSKSIMKDANQQSLVMSLTTGSAFNVDIAQYCLSVLISRKAITETQADKLRLPIHEAIANALTHGNLELGSALRESLEDFDHYTETLSKRLADPTYADRRLDIRVDWTEENITVCVHDRGKGYQKDMLSNAIKSGRGLAIIRGTASSVDVTDGGRRITMRFAL